MSDKGLLERCGTGKDYLTEIRSGSFRPSGLRIKRAEAWTKGTWSPTSPGCSAGRRKPETFFQRLGHRASGKQRASALSELKLVPDPPGNGHRSLKDTSSRKVPPKDGNKRTAGKTCHKKQDWNARGCKTRS
ncbi:MAG: hypothetical protein MUE74_00970 [Bacteroidales bacterium]|nr:hypothetical protein [Bacteroidales bacterium]